MKQYSTSFRYKMRLTLQTTTPTIPAIAAVMMIILLLAGTTTTAMIPAVLARTETLSIENRTETEVTTQEDDGLADGEDENASPPSTEAPEMEPSDTLNQTETEGQEPPTTLPSLNNTYATDIYVMNADGTEETRLTDNAAEDGWPSWSPDGEKIAFSSDRDEDSHDIYVMNVDEGTPPPPVSRPQQIINEAISAIENLDNIPQGLRTGIIVLLRQVLDIINDDTTDGTGTVTPIPQ